MKPLPTFALAIVMAAIPVVTTSASDKTLANKNGTVGYGPSQAASKRLARNASTVLADSDWAKTGGGNSLATITLPDSSVVTMGANSEVQMVKFDNPGIATATFEVVGKVRFQVRHPAGARANYTFKTATGQIAVRGTEGDIFAPQGPNGTPGGLQVNVYSVSNPKLPVKVTLQNGQVFTLSAGQSLVVTAAAGALVAAVGAVSNTTFAPFAQLGAPANASSLGISATTTTAAGATTTAAASAGVASTTAAAVAVGTAAAVNVVSNNVATPAPSASPSPTPAPTGSPTPTPTPTASPAPSPTSTTVPIVVSGQTPSPFTGLPPTMLPGGPARGMPGAPSLPRTGAPPPIVPHGRPTPPPH